MIRVSAGWRRPQHQDALSAASNGCSEKSAGLYISATGDFLFKERSTAIGFARAVAKGTIFVETNPEASAYIFLKTYPEAAPRAATIQEQVKAILNPIEKRVPLLSHYDKSVKDLGRILPSEWVEELKFARGSSRTRR